jgi:signal transduction histidine kinase
VCAVNACQVVASTTLGRSTSAEPPFAAYRELDDETAVRVGVGVTKILAMVAGPPQERCPLVVTLNALCRLFDATAVGCSSSLLLVDSESTRNAVGPEFTSQRCRFFEGQLGTRPQGMAEGPNSPYYAPIKSPTGELLGWFVSSVCKSINRELCISTLLQQFTIVASIVIELRRTEVALKQCAAHFASTQRLSSTGSFSWRPATKELNCSDELYRILEFSPTGPYTFDLIGTRVHPEDYRLFQETANQAQTGGDLECEFRVQTSNGAFKYVRLAAHGIRDEAGRLDYIGAIQDITAHRLTEETLDKVQSELAHVTRVTTLSYLTASIAHEIRQPLSGIVTNAGTCLRMLATEPPDLEGARETARRTLRDGQRTSDVIDRLRALFRKSEPPESINISDLTRDVILLLANDFQRAGVTLRTQLSDNIPLVSGDRVLLQQVIVNLLLNSLDAMKGITDRPIDLNIKTTQEAGGAVRFDVRDVGVGLPADPETLFQTFHTTKTSGMGIGLSISRTIIAKHGGRLWAEPNDGPGATFSFCIPPMVKRSDACGRRVAAARKTSDLTSGA